MNPALEVRSTAPLRLMLSWCGTLVGRIGCITAVGVLVVCGASPEQVLAAAPSGHLTSVAERWSADGEAGTPSFLKHVVPLFNKLGCSTRSCHGAFQGQNGFRLSLFGYDPALDHAELTADEGQGPRVNPDDVDSSLALRKPLYEVEHGGEQRFERDSWMHHLMRDWIAAGAPSEPYDATTGSIVSRLEMIPGEITLADGQSASLRAVAHYADGSREDVTPLSTFETNDESVARVSDAGAVTWSGTGDTAIVVMYAGKVVTVPVIAPQVLAAPFPSFPANSEIDRLVAAKLDKVGILPSALCTDEVFIRRAMVDSIGTMPTADEVRAYLSDPRADKRARLIDAILDRPEYAIYWASIFSDWTGNNRSNINSNSKISVLWHDWLCDKLGKNLSYDELVGAIVTATSREGRTLDEYLEENKTVAANMKGRTDFDDGNYARRRTLDLYWLKRMPDPDKAFAIRTANSFLGVQIQCAECHKHPFDRWTQSDFESFASIFRTVRDSNLDGSPFNAGRRDYHLLAVYPGIDRRYKEIVERYPPKILGGQTVRIDEENPDARVALWHWMRSPDNPYFATNIANRLWQHYFGVGIIEPVDDANAANPPSNAALLDWLAEDFVRHGFDLKHLHRRIMNSRAYQLSSVPNDSNRADRRNFSRHLVKRMPAEVALDALAQATGTELEFSSYAARKGTRAIGVATPVQYGAPEYFMQTFGRPKREQTCACERSNESSLSQALFMINDADVLERIAGSDGRLARLLESCDDDRRLVDELYLTCLARYPTDEERQIVAKHAASVQDRQAAMQDVLWGLVNVREFLFVR